jgi:pSer/pThr/pTyr-binding forkhead associated (FHA) protein
MKAGETMILESRISVAGNGYVTNHLPVSQVFVFKDETLLGWDCFYTSSIRVGSHPDSDILLDDPSIAGRHAVFYIKGDKIVVSAKDHELDLWVNQKRVTSSILTPLDYVDIGPYTLKVRIPDHKHPGSSAKESPGHSPRRPVKPMLVNNKKNQHEAKKADPSTRAPLKYRIIFRGELIDGFDPEAVNANLCALLPSDTSTVKAYLGKQKVLAIHANSLAAAKTHYNALKKAGARCTIEMIAPDAGHPPAHKTASDRLAKAAVPAPEMATPEQDIDPQIPLASMPAARANTISMDSRREFDPDEDDEREEEEHIQPFLKEELAALFHPHRPGTGKPLVLEIIAFKGSSVINVEYIAPKGKFKVTKQGRSFCLSSYKSADACDIFFSKADTGCIQERGAADQPLSELCTPENRLHKKKGLYGIALSSEQTAILENEECSYQLRLVPEQESPKVTLKTDTVRPFYKSLIKSSGIHVALMVLLSLFLAIPEMPGPKEPESHFVKIDTRQLQKPKPVKAAPKPAIPKAATQPKPVKTSKQKKRLPKPQQKPTTIVRKAPTKTSPRAGAGSGKAGNVKTRNVKETGILGLIGDNIGLAPKEALASVTNMDIVSSPGASENNMKIGGIAGRIPGSKVELVAGDVVRAKGSSQVLRSAGIEGKGEVAALRKGKTGQNQVMAKVSVDLEKTVRIQGGMSREAVKRVIDQHLDEISFCYENALMDAPSLMGNIVFEWKILMTGKVGAVRIKSSTVRSNQIHNCIQGTIKTWQFPKPQNTEVMVSYPFVFDIVGF